MSDLNFTIHQDLSIEGKLYTVKGYITFRNNNDGYIWTEYMLVSDTLGTRWLSYDDVYQEYAIYEKDYSSQQFSQQALEKDGFRECDSGTATVTACKGDVDVKVSDVVTFSEYEASDGEHIRAIEQWEDETEYSTGYYLDLTDIKTVQLNAKKNNNTSFNQTSTNKFTNGTSKQKSSSAGLVIGLIIGFNVILFLMGSGFLGSIFHRSSSIKDYLEQSSSFQYVTSITSNLNESEKADVYSTELSVDSATKNIIDGIEGNTEDVEQNKEDSSVAILTSNEYCLVYEDENHLTYIQISNRKYAYSSTNAPYHARRSTHSYYRRYYYSRGYNYDSSRYDSKRNAYSDYNEAELPYSYNDTYNNYSNTVRQRSTSSRTSTGGGSGFGK